MDNRYARLYEEFENVMSGKRGSPRWRICNKLFIYDITNDQQDHVMELAVGAMFVRKYFSKTDRDAAVEMVKDLKQTFIGMLSNMNLGYSKRNVMIKEVGKAAANFSRRSVHSVFLRLFL